MPRATVFKLVGLIVFFGLMAAVVVAVWPTISGLFEEGGAENMVAQIKGAGVWGVLTLLGFQFLQVVVAFIPGEVVQVVAGMMYGPWGGAAIILVGCVISSAFIYALVHKLGAPFVQAMVPTTFLEKFRSFEASGRLGVLVFILFLIPGLPKDTFTYLVPLTDMRLKPYLILTTVARIPGVLLSTFAASGLTDGNFAQSAVLFGIAAILAVAAIMFRKPLMRLLDRFNLG